MSIILWTIFLVIAWHWFVGKKDMHSIWGGCFKREKVLNTEAIF